MAAMTIEHPASIHEFLLTAQEVSLSDEREVAKQFKAAELMLVRKTDQMVVATSTGSDYDELFSGFLQSAAAKSAKVEIRESDYRFVPGPAKLLHLARLMAEGQDRVKSTERT